MARTSLGLDGRASRLAPNSPGPLAFATNEPISPAVCALREQHPNTALAPASPARAAASFLRWGHGWVPVRMRATRPASSVPEPLRLVAGRCDVPIRDALAAARSAPTTADSAAHGGERLVGPARAGSIRRRAVERAKGRDRSFFAARTPRPAPSSTRSRGCARRPSRTPAPAGTRRCAAGKSMTVAVPRVRRSSAALGAVRNFRALVHGRGFGRRGRFPPLRARGARPGSPPAIGGRASPPRAARSP